MRRIVRHPALAWIAVTAALAACAGAAGRPADPGTRAPETRFRPWSYLGCRIGDTRDGIRVTETLPGSASATAGLLRGDLVRALDGRFAYRSEEVIDGVRARLPGTTVRVTVERDGRELAIPVVTAPYPREEQLYNMLRSAYVGLDYVRSLELVELYLRLEPEGVRRPKVLETKRALDALAGKAGS